MSFLIDTNLICEIRKGNRCDSKVWKWHGNLPVDNLYLSVLTMGEIRKGIELSRVKDTNKALVLERRLKDLEFSFEERILPVSSEIADVWGRLVSRCDIAVIDGLIAATAACPRLTVATRNTKDFQRCGVDYFNPFVD